MEKIDSPPQERVHHNRAQLRAQAVEAQHEVDIWGRGTGKSVGRLAPRVLLSVFGDGQPGPYEQGMPRSMGACVGISYTQILTRTLPQMLRGFERYGMRKDVDFTIRARGPRAWPTPLFQPQEWTNFIHFRNGAAMMLVSQQNIGAANGPDIDWAVGDEAKFLKREQYEEGLLPAMRGNKDRFGNSSLHHGTCLTTDMPTTPQSRWLLDKESDMDAQRVQDILELQVEASQLRRAILSGKLAPPSARVYASRLKRLVMVMNEMRRGLLYFSMASSVENIAVLGEEYLLRQKQLLPDYIFRTSVLNMRPNRVEGGFYPDLDEDRHTYIPPDAQYVYQADNDLITGDQDLDDCRKDGDLVPGIPLEIGPDFGSSFNCLVVGQLFDTDFNVLNQVFVKHPHKIMQLAALFHRYYQYHNSRRVRVYYDHTMIGEDAVRNYGFILELRRELESHGWDVELVYIGQAPGHHEKYVFMGRRFANADPLMPRVRWNRVNCQPTLQSMRLAGAKQTRKGFEKDKDPEKNASVDQAEATHLSDACDLLLIGRFVTLGADTRDSVSTMYD